MLIKIHEMVQLQLNCHDLQEKDFHVVYRDIVHLTWMIRGKYGLPKAGCELSLMCHPLNDNLSLT